MEAPSWGSIEGATDRGASTKNRHVLWRTSMSAHPVQVRHVLWQTSMSVHPVQAREREEGVNDGTVD